MAEKIKIEKKKKEIVNPYKHLFDFNRDADNDKSEEPKIEIPQFNPEDPNKIKKKYGFFDNLVKYFPELQKNLIIANVLSTPAGFLKKSTVQSIINSAVSLALLFLVLQRSGSSLFILIPLSFVFFFVFFAFDIMRINALISKKRKAIDNEVVYVGRYMLLKLHSGRPLLNVLIDQSQSYGITSHYIKGIVNDVNSGSTIEESLSRAMEYTPSDRFRKVLFYISNALKYGVDVSGPLEWALDEIVDEDILEIKRYGKKMNSLMIFYMLLAVVMPSLGITIFIVITGFLSIVVDKAFLFLLNFFVLIIQLLFLGVVRSIRPRFDL